ncbi:MAG TPA: glycosyltransferase [Acidobacteriota bacterium]
MRIGYVLKSFPRLSETFILNEIRELERLGCQITIFSRYQSREPVPHRILGQLRAEVVQLEPLLRERLWEAFLIHRRLARRYGNRHDRVYELALSYRSREEMRYWLLAAALAEQAITRRLDLLHAHFASGSASVARYAGAITRVPFSLTAHAKDIYANEVDRRRLRDLLQEAAAAITISEANRRYLRGLAPAARLHRVYNGIDPNQFGLRPFTPPAAVPLVLFVGRLVPKKGVSDLVRACAQLRDRGVPIRCRIVGGGELEAELRAQVCGLNLAGLVEFCGPASQEQVAEHHLGAADLFALPAVVAEDGDRDGVPTTLLEAMARGVPVVSTLLPGIDEAIPHGVAGLLVEPGNVLQLADSIRQALDQPQLSRKRAAAARRHVEERFDIRTNAARLLEVMRAAAGAGSVEAVG